MELAEDIKREILSSKLVGNRGKSIMSGNSTALIRESGLPMKAKKMIKAAVLEEENTRTKKREKGIGSCTVCAASIGMSLQHLKYRMSDFLYSINFWEGALKSVEGHFGTGVGSYFRFLKWLFLLNIPIFLICFSFVTIPQLTYDLRPVESTTNKASNATITTVARPTKYEESCRDLRRKGFLGWEILTGHGNFSCSQLYYGHYTNETIEVITGWRYPMPLFYMLAIGFYFMSNLVVIAIRISSSYRSNFIEGSGDLKFYFVNKVFGGWDFGISDAEAAQLKRKSLRQEIGEHISLVTSRRQNRKSKSSWTCLVLQHVLTNAIVVALLAGAGYLTYKILHEKDFLKVLRSNPILDELLNSLILTGLILFVPKIFSLLALVETYKLPQKRLYMSLARSFCLYGVILGNLLWFWYPTLDCDAAEESTQSCGRRDECWENYMGQEIYRLVIMDFIITLIDSLITDFLRSLVVRIVLIKILKRNPSAAKELLPHFNVPLNTLNLIYSQSLTWFGIFYSPLLPVVQLIKLFLLFYLKKVSVLKNCSPFSQPWRGARIQTIFHILLFVGFMTAVVLLGCSLYLANPSKDCGPYRGQEKVNDVILEFFKDFENKILGNIINFLSSSWFIVAVIVFLAVQVYYARVSAVARLETVTLLKNQLQLSSYDKQFLLKQIQENTDYFAAQKIEETRESNDDDPKEVETIGPKYPPRETQQLVRFPSTEEMPRPKRRTREETSPDKIVDPSFRSDQETNRRQPNFQPQEIRNVKRRSSLNDDSGAAEQLNDVTFF